MDPRCSGFHTDFTSPSQGFLGREVYFQRKLTKGFPYRKVEAMEGKGWEWIQWAGTAAAVLTIVAGKIWFMRWWDKRKRADKKEKEWREEK